MAREGLPEPPRTLSKPHTGLWRAVRDYLSERDLWHATTADVVTAYVEALIVKGDAWEQLRRGKLLAGGSMGQEVVSPLWKVYREARQDVSSLAAELCLTPRVRRQLDISAQKADDGSAFGGFG